ncbi:MAG: ATP-binding protein [Cyclobacteriaceae bacterium]
MRKPVNPFILSGYHSPEYFCDREEDLAWLMEQFENERNAVLYSWRRMGKTALLKHFFHSLHRHKKGEGIFIDLLGTASLTEANKRIASGIVQHFGEPEKGVGAGMMKLLGSIGATVGIDPLSGTPQLTFGISGSTQSVPASFEAMGSFLAENKKPVVICLDEFQQVVNYPEPSAEAVFRTWMQDFPMVRFVFSGSHREMMVSMFSERSRPFYRSAQIRQLDPLSEPVYGPFIRSFFQKAGKKIEQATIDKVFRWTRLQTYYVQLVCNKLFGKADIINDKLTNEVFDEILQQETPLLSSYQQLLTNFQWKLLVALARSEGTEIPLSKDFLRTNELGAASSVSTALRTLMKKEFVIHEGGKYTLHDTLLFRWLQRL